MSKVIDFKTPAQLRDELSSTLADNAALRSELASVSAVKEMLTLQVLDLKEQVAGMTNQMSMIQQNLDKLLAKLTS
jgi:predicted  nucleic acid-binding Zn-ribbon protein